MERPNLEKMYACRSLLPEPGPEVVGELIRYAFELEAELDWERDYRDSLLEDLARYK